MLRNLKKLAIFAFFTSFIGVLGASEAKRDPEKTHLITTRAMIQDDFSGLEATPIVKAFVSWMEETRGDILVSPPNESDGVFYDVVMKGDGNDLQVFDMDLKSDGSTPDPWDKGCRHTFYIVRVTSNNSVVKAIDKDRDSEVLAFTFSGCAFKFIAVVADRMRDEKMMYTTMLHELGHMWGLPDNKDGQLSIMNGSWPGSSCITKKDVADVYNRNGKPSAAPKDTGCTAKEQ